MSKFDICLLKVLGQAVLKQKLSMDTFTVINKFYGHIKLKTKLFRYKNNPVMKPVNNLKIKTKKKCAKP